MVFIHPLPGEAGQGKAGLPHTCAMPAGTSRHVCHTGGRGCASQEEQVLLMWMGGMGH